MTAFLDRWELPLICALLRGEAPAWPAEGGVDDSVAAVGRFVTAARTHGVIPLLDSSLTARGLPHDLAKTWPETVQQACRREFIAQTVLEMARRRELLRVLQAFGPTCGAPLILKGSALAYSHYDSPALRPRSDTDLLIRADDTAQVDQVLTSLGYSCLPGQEAEHSAYETTWSRTDTAGIEHHLDVHRRLNNAQVFAKALTYDELMATSVPVPALGPHARAPNAVHALLYACIHRAGHAHMPFYSEDETFFGGDRLIWFYDMKLLLAGMSGAEIECFAEMAAAKQLKAICLDALLRAQELLGVPLPATLVEALQPTGVIEPSARYLSASARRLMLDNFLALESTAERLTWLKEVCFPPAAHMQRKYPNATTAPLPILYARRAWGGVAKLLKRH